MTLAHSTHKDTHEQLVAHMIRPVTTPREHIESKPATTNYLLAAGSSMHYTPKVPKIIVSFKINLCYPGKPLCACSYLAPASSLRPAAMRARRCSSAPPPPSTDALRPARRGTNMSEHTARQKPAHRLQTAVALVPDSAGSNPVTRSSPVASD